MSDKNTRIASSIRLTRERRKSQICKVFQLKIQTNSLSKAQQEALKMVFIEAKWIYNDALSQEKPYEYKPSKTATVRNKDGNYEQRALNHIGSQLKQSVIKGLINNIASIRAKKAKGAKVGRLKFISNYTSVNLVQNEFTYKIRVSKIKIQAIPGWLKIRGTHQLDGWELANAKLINKPDGYYLHVTAFKDKTEIIDKFKQGTIVGIDMGLTTHITTSDGRRISAVVGETDRLRRLQRKLSKQNKGSNNYRKTRNLIQREYQKMSNKKNDIANKIVHNLLLNEQVFMQDENLTGWRKTLKGNKQHSSILGRVKMKLVHHERVVVLPRNVATTQTCVCGKKNKHSLNTRVYSCDCGYTADRDVHAARNMIRLQIPVERRKFTLVESELDWLSLSAKPALLVEARSN